MKQLLKRLGLKDAYCIDFETFWSNDYTLKKLATTEYIYDERFEAQLVAVQKYGWTKPRVMETPQFVEWAQAVDWSSAAMLAHHAHFDGLIAHHHFGIDPAFYFDTLSMGRALMPVSVGGSLIKLCAAFGRQAKRHGAALVQTKGKHWADFTKTEKANLKLYAGDDAEDTWFLFDKLQRFIPDEELRLIHSTIKMYAQPSVLFDKAMLLELAESEVQRKEALMARLKLTPSMLQSNDQFAALLENYGVDPPTKPSPKHPEKRIFAFAKNDADFKALLEHDDEDVRDLVSARLGVKSTMVESRAFRLAARADYGPQPVYLNYWGALTGRWSGGDAINLQNLKRGSPLRNAIMAPKGYSFIIADLAQIEARINAWFSGQQDIVDAFARGEDVYSVAASSIFGRRINKDDHPAERFAGKTAVLGLGYGAGAPKFHFMLRNPPAGTPDEAIRYAASLTEGDVMAIHRGWRQSNPFIVANWKATQKKIEQAFFTKTVVEDGVVSYQGKGDKCFMWLPGGMAIRYDDMQLGEDGMTYLRKKRATTEVRGRLYGALYVENRTQALARRVIGENMIAIDASVPNWRQATSTHDEIVGLVPTRQAKKALGVIKEIMSTPPEWAPDLPLAVDAHISQRYDK